jgi:hypothetical protein
MPWHRQQSPQLECLKSKIIRPVQNESVRKFDFDARLRYDRAGVTDEPVI